MSPKAELRWLLLLLLLVGCSEDETALELVGTVERTLIELVAPVSETIVAVGAERGQHVEPGEAIVRLDTTLAGADIAAAEATLTGALTGALVAQTDLERAQQLHRDRVASAQALDRARLQRDEAAARQRAAAARLAAALKGRADLTLASPVPGVVDQLPFDPGERVAAGAVVAVVLADAEPWVRVWIPQASFARVGPGTRAEIRIDGVEGAMSGHVLDVAREPEFTPHYALTERDRVHLVFETRVRIEDAPASLRPGVPAQVRLRPDAPRVPKEP